MTTAAMKDRGMRELSASELDEVSGGLQAAEGALGFAGLAVGLAVAPVAMPVALGVAAGAAVISGGIAVYEALQ